MIALSTQPLIGISILPWSLLNSSATFPRLRMSISLDLMLLPNMTGSHVNLPFGNHLGGRKSYVEFKHTFPAQLSSAIKLCPLVLCFDPRIALCWLQTLWLSLFAIPLLHNACSYNLIGATGNFTLGVCPVMVPWLAIYGAATEPRASLWAADAWLCCWVRAGIEVSNHDPLWNYVDVSSHHELFLDYIY